MSREALDRERSRVALLLDAAAPEPTGAAELTGLAQLLRRASSSDAAAIMLPESEQGVRIRALDFPGGNGIVREQMWIPLDGSALGRALREQQVHVLRAAEFEVLSPEVRQADLAEGFAAMCAVPLVQRGQFVGGIFLATRAAAGFGPETLGFFERARGLLAGSVERRGAAAGLIWTGASPADASGYVGGSGRASRELLEQADRVARTSASVLIRGETGTGKEMLARRLHEQSPRRERRFIAINCAALPSNLIESELFGHERGAFTGAAQQRAGCFELADGGTLLLDEIGDLPLELQPKLLRVLQEGEFTRLGGTRPLRVDVRVLAATHRDLEQMLAAGEFRADLYYRLNVFPLRLVPLRERPEEIPLLAQHFLRKHASRLGSRAVCLATRSLGELLGYSWPGNVRELENAVERALITADGAELEVRPSAAPASRPAPLERFTTPLPEPAPAAALTARRELGTSLREVERRSILAALDETRWVLGGPRGAAARLGLKRTSLQARMQRLGISRPKP